MQAILLTDEYDCICAPGYACSVCIDEADKMVDDIFDNSHTLEEAWEEWLRSIQTFL